MNDAGQGRLEIASTYHPCKREGRLNASPCFAAHRGFAAMRRFGRNADLTPKRSTVHRLLDGLRILSQAFFFCLFLFLLMETRYTGKDYIGAVESFFHFDPLLGLTTYLASREFLRTSLWAMVTVVLTVSFGRYVCGWVCPLGAVLQFFSYLFKKAKIYTPSLQGTRLLNLKYSILVLVLTASVFTLDLTGLLDPLSLLYRSFTAAVLPSLAVAGDSGIPTLHGIGLTSLGSRLGEILQSLAVNRIFQQSLAIGVIFLAIVLLNSYRERFWCRYLCPAGALLALLSRWSIVKVDVDADKCIQCKACTLHCHTQANPFPAEDWKPGECVYCYSCSSRCPTAAITFPIAMSTARAKSVNFGRRKWMLATILGTAIAPLFHISESVKRASTKLIRPPGALPEPKFLTSCVKCGECMKVCPTNALQPAWDQAGPEGLWTPVLVPKIGYCEYYCSLCTQVCPTGALKELKIAEKISVKIGSAWINKNRCIPYTFGEPCNVCEEKCPTSPKAISMINSEAVLPDGGWATQKVPVVDLGLCIGCGICETKCPVSDDPAIYCTGLGESRSQESNAF